MTYAEIAGSQEFAALSPEEKKTVAQRFWSDNPSRAEAAVGLIDTTAAIKDAAPIDRRFLEAQAEDQAFSLLDVTPEQAQEYSAIRDERNASLEKTQRLFSADNQQAASNIFRDLTALGRNTDKFGTESLRSVVGDVVTDTSTEQRNQQYEETRNSVSEQFGITPDELDDVVRHNLNAQEKPISRDALGQVHVKNDLIFKGKDAIKSAIESSDLPASVKQTQLNGLDKRLNQFETNIVENVKKNYPEYAQEIGLDGKEDYNKIADTILNDRTENEATSFVNTLRKSGVGLFNTLNKLPGARGDRSNLFASVADSVEKSRRIDEAQLALSQQ